MGEQNDHALEIQEIFRLFDLNGDGFITIEELGIVMDVIGQNFKEKDLCATLRQVDMDGNGTIDIEEFERVMMHEASKADSLAQLEEEIKRVFLAFDKDQNGFISSEELMCVLKSLGGVSTKEDVLDMMKQADLDGDGFLSYHEFFQIMMEES